MYSTVEEGPGEKGEGGNISCSTGLVLSHDIKKGIFDEKIKKCVYLVTLIILLISGLLLFS